MQFTSTSTKTICLFITLDRTALLAIIFGGIFVAPALVFLLRFPNSVVRPHVVPWSLWIAISWAAGCVLSLIVDLFPRVLLSIIFVFYGCVISL